jgi:DNA-binding GntR family transcriptional regulator
MATSLAQSTYESIREKLLSGEIQPGDRLVNRTLAESLGVSVIPVREAINRLASEGLIELIPHAGAFARKFDRREIVKLYSFREQLECYAVREAASHADALHLEQLNHVIQETTRFLNDIDGDEVPADKVDNWMQLDAAFHKAIIEASDNPWLEKATSELHLLSHVIGSKPRHTPMDVARKTLEEHQAITQAISDKNGEQAVEIMSQHIRCYVPSLVSGLNDE